MCQQGLCWCCQEAEMFCGSNTGREIPLRWTFGTDHETVPSDWRFKVELIAAHSKDTIVQKPQTCLGK